MFAIPFKHGRKWLPGERAAFEKKVGFTFPREFIQSYGDWNGGSIEGDFIFRSPVCEDLVINKFLSLIDIDAKSDRFHDGILSEIQNNSFLYLFPLVNIPFVPFAIVDCSYHEKEAGNVYNVRSVLAFERKAGEVVMLSGYREIVVPIAKSWDLFTKLIRLVDEF